MRASLLPKESVLNGEVHPASDPARIEQIKVWDVPTRLFHWLLAVSFAGAWLTRDSERWRDTHMMFGYTVAGLLVFRLVWGFVGSYYARFASFDVSPRDALAYMSSLLGKAPKRHVGHNPAGAVAAVLMIGLGALTAAAGAATIREIGDEWVAYVHVVAAKTLLAVVAIHLLGVLASSLAHRENLVRSMITGRKSGRHIERIGRPRTGVGMLLFVAVIGYWTADSLGWLASSATTSPIATRPTR
jgi:cytochrome b